MSYQVLARKWRPRRFDELVGQEHVVRALANALDRNQVHHAFLFTGTRGVGKTTIARIFAKSLNCETGVSSRPCGKCSSCEEVDSGRFVDLIEVDAASRTKVEDTRELLENVQYAPTRGRYKVYLIDEVHMLSGHSFNALLKTLEEPPPHVKFLLATTDPQKLPVTILSRCLQFSLKRLQMTQIVDQLTRILEAEAIGFEAPALELIARGADGSMRDALSLMDQAIAYGAGGVNEADVRQMMGAVDRKLVWNLLSAIAAGDAASVIAQIREWSQGTPDFMGLLAELIGALQRTALIQMVGDTMADGEDGGAAAELAAGLTPELVQLYYQIALHGRRDLPLAPDEAVGFEMVALRMLAFKTVEMDFSGGGAPTPQRNRTSSAIPQAPVRTEPPAPRPAPPANVGQAQVAGPAADDPWEQILGRLDLGGMALQLARQCRLKTREAESWVLELDAAHKGLLSSTLEEKLLAALGATCGVKRLKFEINGGDIETPARRAAQAAEARQAAAEEAIESDPLVRSLEEKFGATVCEGSIKPTGIQN